MFQRPGFFAYVVFGLLIGTMVCANALNTMPRVDEAQAAEDQAAAPTASASDASTAMPDVLATTDAAGVATSQAARAWQTDTQVVRAEGTRVAETQTPASWTQSAIVNQQVLNNAEIDQALLGVQQLAATVTMMPTADWMTDVARWPTAQAEQTQAAFEQQQADKRRGWEALVADLWGAAAAAVPTAILIALVVSAIVLPNALSWRLQGAAGGQAQATVEQSKRREPIPTTTSGQPSLPIDPHTKTEHLALRVLGRMAGISGADSTMLTSAPEFNDNRGRDRVVAALCASGLAVSENGVGVGLTRGQTIGDVVHAIASGGIRLPDPPTPAEDG